MTAELLIQNGNKVFIPVVQEDIQLTTERKGNPGKLTFKVHLDDVLDITEGNAVRLKWNGANIFYGFQRRWTKKESSQSLHMTRCDI